MSRVFSKTLAFAERSENIWTNISKNQHIFDLKKMSIKKCYTFLN